MDGKATNALAANQVSCMPRDFSVGRAYCGVGVATGGREG